LTPPEILVLLFDRSQKAFLPFLIDVISRLSKRTLDSSSPFVCSAFSLLATHSNPRLRHQAMPDVVSPSASGLFVPPRSETKNLFFAPSVAWSFFPGLAALFSIRSSFYNFFLTPHFCSSHVLYRVISLVYSAPPHLFFFA